MTNGSQPEKAKKSSSFDHRYEAWRNFVLIVASVLVADAFGKFDEIRRALASVQEFDKTYDLAYWPQFIGFLLMFYVAKNTHGLLLTLFDDEYRERIQHSRLLIATSCGLTSGIVVSFVVILRLSSFVESGLSLFARGGRLMLFALVPSISLFLFDWFYVVAFARDEFPSRRVFLAGVVKELWMRPVNRTGNADYKKVWIAEDAMSLVLVGVWLAVMYGATRPSVRIFWTFVLLSAILLLNSLADYVLNCNYFFYHKAANGGEKSSSSGTSQDARAAEHAAPASK